MENSLYLPEAEFDLELLDPKEIPPELTELSLEPGDALLPEEVSPPETMAGTEDVAMPDGMAPCLVPGCPGVNLYTPLKRFRHWHYQHIAQHHRFRCAAPGCRKVTRKPKDIRCHMRKTHGLTAPEALTLTFADEKAVPNPSYKDPGTCPAPPGYAQWLKRVDGDLRPQSAATGQQRALITSVFDEERRSREVTIPQPQASGSPAKLQHCHAGCQTIPMKTSSTARDKEWVQLIQQWKASNQWLQSRVQTLSREKAELKRKLSATEASLEKAVEQRRKTLDNM